MVQSTPYTQQPFFSVSFYIQQPFFSISLLQQQPSILAYITPIHNTSNCLPRPRHATPLPQKGRSYVRIMVCTEYSGRTLYSVSVYSVPHTQYLISHLPPPPNITPHLTPPTPSHTSCLQVTPHAIKSHSLHRRYSAGTHPTLPLSPRRRRPPDGNTPSVQLANDVT